MSRGVQERVKEMYEAHPYPRVLDPVDPVRRAQSQRHFDYLGLTRERFAGATVLDAGCGTGEKALYMSTLGPKKVVGIDLSSASVRHAEQNAVRYGTGNLSYQTGSVLELPFGNDSFDI